MQVKPPEVEVDGVLESLLVTKTTGTAFDALYLAVHAMSMLTPSMAAKSSGDS